MCYFKMAARRSGVWGFFSVSVTDKSMAVCDECGERVARGGCSAKSYTTTNLTNHLKRRHFSQYTELLELEKTKSAADDDSSCRSPSPVTARNLLLIDAFNNLNHMTKATQKHI